MEARRNVGRLSELGAVLGTILVVTATAQPRISQLDPLMGLTVTETFPNGVCTLELSESVQGPWQPVRSRFTTSTGVVLPFDETAPAGTAFYRVRASDLDPHHVGFGNLIDAYSLLTTIAGSGGTPSKGVNKWRPEFEGGAATTAELSRPHIAMADAEGNIYIADKDAHAVRRVTPEGMIHTVAGTGLAGNGPDTTTPGRQVALSAPNGLWVTPVGVVFILDLDNGKIRRLASGGELTTFITVAGGISVGRGLWVSEDETLAYIASGSVVKRWILGEGVIDFATGFAALGNLVVDPQGNLVVTDRGAHRVYRLSGDGSREVIAGNGTTFGGGEDQPAIETGLNEVRGVWFLPTGAFFVGTHAGSQVWFVDTAGIIHLFVHGTSAKDSHGGDGTHFYAPAVPRISEVRAITMDHEGNLLITEHDAGYVRKILFLPQYH